MTQSRRVHNTLSTMLTVTTIGDWFSYLSVIYLLQNISGDWRVSSFSIPIKGLGIAVSALFSPYLNSRISPKRLLVAVQILGMALSLVTFLFLEQSSSSMTWLFWFSCFQGFLSNCFNQTRDFYSKAFTTDDKALKETVAQSLLEKGFSLGQVFGPVLFFVLIHIAKARPSIAFLIDAVSFFVGTLLLLRLPGLPIKLPSPSYKQFGVRPILERTPIRFIFVLRSIGMWVPFAIFNILLVAKMTAEFHRDPSELTWVYALLGAGATVGANWSGQQSDRFNYQLSQSYVFCAASFVLFALCSALFAFSIPFSVFLMLCFMIGFSNGIQKVTTKGILREQTSTEEFPVISALELFTGKLCDLVTVSIFNLALISISGGVSFTAIWLTGLGLITFLATPRLATT